MPKKTKDASKAEGKNLFSTPAYATRMLLPYLNKYTLVWECAAGEGRMADVLDTQHSVWQSDIQPRNNVEKFDFLKEDRDPSWLQNIDYIVTNPPFDYKIQFYHKCMQYWHMAQIPFALLIPADYTAWIIKAVREDMCQKLVPTRRIDYLTPNMLQRINAKELTNYQSLSEVPAEILPHYTSSDFHSFWLVKGLNIRIPVPVLPTEIYVELSLHTKKTDILIP